MKIQKLTSLLIIGSVYFCVLNGMEINNKTSVAEKFKKKLINKQQKTIKNCIKIYKISPENKLFFKQLSISNQEDRTILLNKCKNNNITSNCNECLQTYQKKKISRLDQKRDDYTMMAKALKTYKMKKHSIIYFDRNKINIKIDLIKCEKCSKYRTKSFTYYIGMPANNYNSKRTLNENAISIAKSLQHNHLLI